MARKGHGPHISISDDNHHVTEAIGSYYDDEQPSLSPARREPRPLSYVTSPLEVYENTRSSSSKRQGSYFDGASRGSPTRVPLGRRGSNDKVPSPSAEGAGNGGSGSSKSVKRMGSMGSENSGGSGGGGDHLGSPKLSRHNSTDTAVQQFPLNDIDYESSPAAVAQELSNLQAIRRMSMNVDTADPDLPSFASGFGAVPTVAPNKDEDENDASRLFWVPARLHPELAPKEFKTFIEDRVDKIRRRSGDSDSLSVDGLERSMSGTGSLRRKKSMLSNQVDPKGNYEDGAERLERKRSKGMHLEGQAQVDLQELETLVSDPAQLMRRMSLDTARRSQDSGIEVPPNEDLPILPPVGQTLKRSTRTTYRRGSLKKGERVPFSKRAQQRLSEPDVEEPSQASSGSQRSSEPILGLTRVQTEPMPPQASSRSTREDPRSHIDSHARRRHGLSPSHSSENLSTTSSAREERASRESPPPSRDGEQGESRPQQRQFQSRLASGGRTTAQLPGYVNPNPLPHIIETLPDGTKVPVNNLVQNIPERKSSHELPRAFQRGGAHMRPLPGREQHQRSQTLDDISSHPSPLPGSGGTRTDALTMVPTFEDRKVEKKDGSRKSSWKWILGSDDEEKEKRGKDDRGSDTSSLKASKSGKLSKVPADKARLDVLQNSIDGTIPPRGRESIVLNREDIKLEEERKKESSKKTSEASTKKDKDKDSGLLSAIFGGKKKASDSDLKQKNRKSDRTLSPDPIPRILKPDIDYNWTRFSILEERAIYRMAHIKLANPRRALYSQVLLSNFMYSYLAKVQMMHPQVQIPAAHQQKGGQGQQQQRKEEQPAEYSQYQRWQQQQERQDSKAATAPTFASASASTNGGSSAGDRTSFEIATGAASQYQDQQQHHQRTSYEMDEDMVGGYDARSSEEYEFEHGYQQMQQQQQHSHPHQQYQQHPHPQNMGGHHRANGKGTSGFGGGGGGGGSGGGGYSVAGTHDYLGYPKGQQPFEQQGGLWDDEKPEELW